jgi:hypothetical protein
MASSLVNKYKAKKEAKDAKTKGVESKGEAKKQLPKLEVIDLPIADLSPLTCVTHVMMVTVGIPKSTRLYRCMCST